MIGNDEQYLNRILHPWAENQDEKGNEWSGRIFGGSEEFTSHYLKQFWWDFFCLRWTSTCRLCERKKNDAPSLFIQSIGFFFFPKERLTIRKTRRNKVDQTWPVMLLIVGHGFHRKNHEWKLTNNGDSMGERNQNEKKIQFRACVKRARFPLIIQL